MSIRKAILVTLIVVFVLLVIASISIRALQGPCGSSADAQPNEMLCYNDPNDKTLRYVNPLVMENAGRLADPTVIKFNEKYYLYLTGGIMSAGNSGSAVWSSEDLVHWEYHKVSSDGETFTTVVDKTNNNWDNAVEFDEIKPIKCRHVRLTITGWPKDLPCGVLEFTVFGKPTPQ